MGTDALGVIIHVLDVLMFYRSSVRVVSSNRSGMGKSLYVQRMGEKLRAISQSASHIALTFPIHGPVVTSETVIDSLQDWAEIDSSGTLIHCDIAPNVSCSMSPSNNYDALLCVFFFRC